MGARPHATALNQADTYPLSTEPRRDTSPEGSEEFQRVPT